MEKGKDKEDGGGGWVANDVVIRKKNGIDCEKCSVLGRFGFVLCLVLVSKKKREEEKRKISGSLKRLENGKHCVRFSLYFTWGFFSIAVLRHVSKSAGKFDRKEKRKS